MSTTTGFFALSFCDAVWAAELPAVQVKLGVSAAAVGWILFAANAGVVVMPVAGRCVDRFGSHRVLVAAGAASGLLWIVPGLVGSLPSLGAALLVLGAAKSGFLLVAAEAQASQRERARGRPLMNYYHAIFSVGAVLGALVGSAVTAAGITLPWVLVIVAFGVAGTGVARVFPLLLSIAAGRASEQPGRTMARMVLCTQIGTAASPLLLGSVVRLTTIWSALTVPAVAYLVIALGARPARSATSR